MSGRWVGTSQFDIVCSLQNWSQVAPHCVGHAVVPVVGQLLVLHVEAQVLPEKVPQKLLDVLLQLSCCAVLQLDPQVEPKPEQVGSAFCVGKTPQLMTLLHV